MDKLRDHILIEVKEGKRCCLDFQTKKRFKVGPGRRVDEKLKEIRKQRKG